MHRRNFIKRASLLTGGLLLGSRTFDLNRNPFRYSNKPDIVFGYGCDLKYATRSAVAAMGGLSSIIRRGKKVLIKVDVGENASEISRLNSHPDVVKEVVRQCYIGGAREVYVLDMPTGNWKLKYKNSGVELAVKESFGRMYPVDFASDFVNTQDIDGNIIRLHQLVDKCDTLINIPVIKKGESYPVSGISNLSNLMISIPEKPIDNLTLLRYANPDITIVDFGKFGYEDTIPSVLVGFNPIYADLFSFKMIDREELFLKFYEEYLKINPSFILKAENLTVEQVWI